MNVTYPTVEPGQHGPAICGDCNRPLPVGVPYAERLLRVGDSTAIVEVVCVYCVNGDGQ